MGTVPIWSFLTGFHTQKLWCLSSRGFACSESQRAAGGICGVGSRGGDSRFLSLSQVLTVAFLLPSSWLWDTFLAVDTGIINCSADVDESLP